MIVPNVGSTTLFPLIRARIKQTPWVYSDSSRPMTCSTCPSSAIWRINHRELFADRGNHINGIENFWNQAERHLRRCV